MRILCSSLAALSLALASPAAATIGTMTGSSALYYPQSSDVLPTKNYKEKWKGGGCNRCEAGTEIAEADGGRIKQ